jgi:hypothetical protein
VERQVGARLFVIGAIPSQQPKESVRVEHETWSRHSRRTDPMKRSTYALCQGDRDAVSTSRMSMAVAVRAHVANA